MSVQLKSIRGTVQRAVALARSVCLRTLTPNTCCIRLKMWRTRMHRITCRKPNALVQYVPEHHRRNQGNRASKSTMFITFMKKRGLLGQLTARITNSNTNHIKQTNSTASRTLGSTETFSMKFSLELSADTTYICWGFIAGCVCRENAVIESRMKNRDTTAMTWRNRNIKNEKGATHMKNSNSKHWFRVLQKLHKHKDTYDTLALTDESGLSKRAHIFGCQALWLDCSFSITEGSIWAEASTASLFRRNAAQQQGSTSVLLIPQKSNSSSSNTPHKLVGQCSFPLL